MKNKVPAITLMSDFGLPDGYVAAMKGVIYTEASSTLVIDATHGILPQDIKAGSWVLNQYARTYPPGTIHVAVVDPGVGSDRKAILAVIDEYYFLAPDNALLTWVLESAKTVSLYAIHPEIHAPGEVSATFHGRDVFAYVAGLLASGKASPEDISSPVSAIVQGPWTIVTCKDYRLTGEIVHIDHFGNLIVNISKNHLVASGWKSWRILVGDYTFEKLSATYSGAPANTLISLWGSSNKLELAVTGGAHDYTGLEVGTSVVAEKTA
ncbi:MAG: hypothetical protein GKR87_13965 [Kiritimatiellae bacterium]|nr:hypothetical protein [Kiritimatiellia bacterium]